jgi:hypothetical protein
MSNPIRFARTGSNDQAVTDNAANALPVKIMAGGASAAYSNKTASAVVAAAPATLFGYIVTLYDNASAASGTVLLVIPVSTAAGAYILPIGIRAAAGIYASFAGTGTVNFLYSLTA